MEGKGKIAHDEQFLLFPQCFQDLQVPQTGKKNRAFLEMS